jgi:hypothetical protein
MTNLYFDTQNNYPEQDLIESLVTESISIFGWDVYYCPRFIEKKDEIYSEDTLSTYDAAYQLDMYVRSYDSYEGDGTFLSKFNLEIRDQITFVVSRRMYRSEISTQVALLTRPREGDLIYVPQMKRLFTIKYVNNESIFYQMGALQVWDLVCEVFEYSNERFNTGVPEIDAIEPRYSVSNVFANTAYEEAMNDVFATNQEFQEEGAGVIDFSQIDPFSGGTV